MSFNIGDRVKIVDSLDLYGDNWAVSPVGKRGTVIPSPGGELPGWVEVALDIPCIQRLGKHPDDGYEICFQFPFFIEEVRHA